MLIISCCLTYSVDHHCHPAAVAFAAAAAAAVGVLVVAPTPAPAPTPGPSPSPVPIPTQVVPPLCGSHCWLSHRQRQGLHDESCANAERTA